MIKSINAWVFAPHRTLRDGFRLARETGFEAVEVTLDETGELSLDSTPGDCARIVEAADQAGIALAGLASGLGWRFPLTSTNPDTVRKGIAATTKSLQVARWLHVDALLLVPGGVAAPFIANFAGAPYDVAYENALAALRELAPVAAQNNVSLGVENVWNQFLLSPLEMRDFLDAVGSPFVKSYFDVGNVALFGFPEQWITILGGERIKRVHFKDFKRSVATLAGFCPLGEGDVDWPAVMAALRNAGYNGFVSAEFFNCEVDLPAISTAMDRILAL